MNPDRGGASRDRRLCGLFEGKLPADTFVAKAASAGCVLIHDPQTMPPVAWLQRVIYRPRQSTAD